MSIEISPKDYWKAMCRDEAQMYCLFLVIDGKKGWRFPTYRELIGHESTYHISMLGEWYEDDLVDTNLCDTDDLYCIVPVRDRKDDD
jgi:hypothetical protein